MLPTTTTTCFSAALPRILIHPFFRSDSTLLQLSSPKTHAPICATPNDSHLLTSESELVSNSKATVKIRTAPWMKGPLYSQPQEDVDLASPERRNDSDAHGGEKSYRALVDKRIGKTGRHAMRRIAKSIEKLEKDDDSGETQMKLEEFEFGNYLEGLEESGIRQRMPWEKDDGIVLRRTKQKTFSAAELSLDKALLGRLRGEAAKMAKWVKVNKAGVTQDVVNKIQFMWERNELAMLKFDVPLCRNMDRAREIVEVRLVLVNFLLLFETPCIQLSEDARVRKWATFTNRETGFVISIGSVS